MATQRANLLVGEIGYDDNGNVWGERIDAVFDTDAFFKVPIVVFDDAGADRHIYGRRDIPEDFVGSPEVEMLWSQTTTSTKSINFDFAYRCIGGDAAESLDITTAQETKSGFTDIASGTARQRQILTFTALTAGNFATADTLLWRLTRDSAADTLAAKVYLIGLRLKYTDA